jgi:hypothetical protein
MATWNRKQIGKISKKDADKQRFKDVKDAQGNVTKKGVPEFSLKIEQDITLKAGSYLNLENKAFKLASLEANKDKMSEENYEKALERINKTPEWLFFEVLQVSKES